MKIAHVMRRLSFDDWGGTEQVVWNLAKAQKAAGHDVRIFATAALWKGLAAKNAESAKKSLCPLRSMRLKKAYSEIVDGIEIMRFRPIYPWWPMPKRLVEELDRKGGNPFVPGLGKALRDWRPDVIHCHAMARIAELCLRTAQSLNTNSPTHQLTNSPTRCVISLHGGGANVPDAEAKSLKAPTRWRLPWGKMIDYALGWTRRIPEDADGIVCVGEDEAEKYKTRHPHVLFLPNGVDVGLFKDMASPVPHSPFPVPHSPFPVFHSLRRAHRPPKEPNDARGAACPVSWRDVASRGAGHPARLSGGAGSAGGCARRRRSTNGCRRAEAVQP